MHTTNIFKIDLHLLTIKCIEIRECNIGISNTSIQINICFFESFSDNVNTKIYTDIYFSLRCLHSLIYNLVVCCEIYH